MKRIFVWLTLFMFVAASPLALAFSPSDKVFTSGEKTASALILTGAGFFHQLIVQPDGVNDVTVSVYDNTAASGTKILPTIVFAGDEGPQATPPVWIYVDAGIYVSISVAGGGTVAYTTLYRKQ